MPPEIFLNQAAPLNLSIEKTLKTAAIKFAKQESKSRFSLVAELLAKIDFDRSGDGSEAGRRRTAKHCCSIAPLPHRSRLRSKFVTLVTFLTTTLCAILSAATYQLSYFTQPDGAVIGEKFSQHPVVYVLDDSGNLVDTFSDEVTIAKINGAGTLSGITTVTAYGGIAEFTDLAITGAAGHHVLEVTSPGCTARRSGMMTVNPAATTARVALHFGQNTTDKGDCGSDATIDDLTASDMTIVGRIKRTGTGSNQFVVSKHNSAAGWYVQVATDNGEGTLLAFTDYSGTNARTYANSSNLLAQDVWYDFAAKWVISTKKWRLYLAPVGTALTEAGYNPSPVAGTSTRAADASNNLYIGNIQLTGTNPFKGDIEWMAVFSKALTAAEMLRVQIGFSRAAPTMITNVGSCQLLHRLNGTGPLTDLSPNGPSANICTITGQPYTTSGQTIFVPTVWGNSIDATDKTDYLFTNSHATVSYSTNATSAVISAHRTLEGNYDNQASITVLVDGAYSTQALIPAPTASPTATPQRFNVAYATISLPAGSKTVTFVNGVRSRKDGSTPPSLPSEGTFLTSVMFDQSATTTEVIPSTPAKNILFLADSVLDDFLAAPVGSNGVISTTRENIRNSQNVMVEGYGGAKLYDYASDSTARAATVAKIAKYNPSTLVTDLGANDWGGQGGTNHPWANATAYGAGFDALLTDLHAEMPLLQMYVCTMVTRPAGEGNNSAGDNAAAYRTAAANACSGKSYCTVVDGPTQLWNGVGTDDMSHPNNTGSAAMRDNVKAFLGL